MLHDVTFRGGKRLAGGGKIAGVVGIRGVSRIKLPGSAGWHWVVLIRQITPETCCKLQPI